MVGVMEAVMEGILVTGYVMAAIGEDMSAWELSLLSEAAAAALL